MRECYTTEVFSKPPCLIAKIKLEKSVQLEAQTTVTHARGRIDEWSKLEVQDDFLEKWDLWSKNDILTMIFFDFQLKSFVNPKPVELWESHGLLCL